MRASLSFCPCLHAAFATVSTTKNPIARCKRKLPPARFQKNATRFLPSSRTKRAWQNVRFKRASNAACCHLNQKFQDFRKSIRRSTVFAHPSPRPSREGVRGWGLPLRSATYGFQLVFKDFLPNFKEIWLHNFPPPPNPRPPGAGGLLALRFKKDLCVLKDDHLRKLNALQTPLTNPLFVFFLPKKARRWFWHR